MTQASSLPAYVNAGSIQFSRIYRTKFLQVLFFLFNWNDIQFYSTSRYGREKDHV